MKLADYIMANSMGYKPLRVVSGIATGFRFALYPDGSKRLQGAYQWHEGFTTGIEWKDIPLVEVNIHGQVPNDD